MFKVFPLLLAFTAVIMTVTSASDFMKSFDDCTQSVDIMDKKVKDQILEVIQKYRSGTEKLTSGMVASIEKDVQAEFVKFNLGDKFNGFKMCMKSKMDLK